MTAAWSYSAGRRASSSRPSSRVRVYERDDVPGRIFMTRAWITTESGRPAEDVLEMGVTREYAETLAELTAKKRELALLEGRTAAQEEAAGDLTLKTLLDAYHDSRTAEDWAESHRKDRETCRRFWLGVLGDDLVVGPDHPSPAKIERLARQAAGRNDWSGRTEEKYLGYLHAATRWAWRKARLIEENPLRGLETPDYEQDTSELVYSLEEIALLTTPHEDVDWRVTLAAAIAYETGRRRRAICRLRASGVETTEVELEPGDVREVTFLEFEGESDKAKKTSWVAVTPETGRLVREALGRKKVQLAGWLLPGGHLGHLGRRAKKPLTPGGLGHMLRDAEETLGISHIDGRGWHGIKRRHVTEMFEISGGDVERVKDTTGNLDAELLRRVYRQRYREKTAPSAEALRERLPEPREGDDGATT